MASEAPEQTTIEPAVRGRNTKGASQIRVTGSHGQGRNFTLLDLHPRTMTNRMPLLLGFLSQKRNSLSSVPVATSIQGSPCSCRHIMCGEVSATAPPGPLYQTSIPATGHYGAADTIVDRHVRLHRRACHGCHRGSSVGSACAEFRIQGRHLGSCGRAGDHRPWHKTMDANTIARPPEPR